MKITAIALLAIASLASICGAAETTASAGPFALQGEALGAPPHGAAAATRISFVRSDQELNPLAGRGVALADLNGDGALDAFVVNENTPDGEGCRVYFGDGAGRFAESQQRLETPAGWAGRPAVGDINGDSAIDVIAGRTVWINDGHGYFDTHRDWIEQSGADGRGPVGLADLNNDGVLDLVAVSGGKQLGVYFGDCAGRFRDTGQQLGSGIIGSLALGDVNGDGVTDIESAGWRNKADDPSPSRIWLNDGHGTFVDSGALEHATYHAHGVALGDLNGDGALDLVLAFTKPGHAGRIYFNDGRGKFRESEQRLGHRWAHGVALGDLDGDSSLDVFLACGEPATGTPNEIWLNDGRGNFRDSGVRLDNAFSWSVAVGDLNRDGKLDVVVTNLRLVDSSRNPPVFGGAPLEVWLNTTPATRP